METKNKEVDNQEQQKIKKEKLESPSKKKKNMQAKVKSIKEDVEKNVAQEGPTRTFGGVIGDAVWLMSQSQGHKYLSLADLEWALIPPVILGQYKLFRDDGKKPIGLALWAYLSEEAEKRLKLGNRLAPSDWGNNAQPDKDHGYVPQEGGTLWLVELVCPFSNETNKFKEKMLADVMQTALKDKPFKMMRINLETHKREEILLNQKKQ